MKLANRSLPCAWLLLGLAFPMAVMNGCKKEEDIRSYQAPKEAPAAAVAETSEETPSADEPPAFELTPPGIMRWKLPAGWKQVIPPPARMGIRAAAAIAVSAKHPKLEITISPLPGGVALYPNMERWAGIVQMEPPAESEIGKFVTHQDRNGVSSDIFDLTGPTPPGERLLGAIVHQGGETWAFKLSGPADEVAAQKKAFDEFIASINFFMPPPPSPAAGPPAPSLGPPLPSANVPSAIEGGTEGVHWALPAGWTASPASGMRLATIHPDSNGQTEIKVSKFGALGGGAGANVTRWRREVGLAPVSDADADPGQTVKAGAATLTIHDYTGPANGGTREIIAQTAAGGATWYFKLIGPTSAVAGQKAAWDQFLASLRFDP